MAPSPSDDLGPVDAMLMVVMSLPPINSKRGRLCAVGDDPARVQIFGLSVAAQTGRRKVEISCPGPETQKAGPVPEKGDRPRSIASSRGCQLAAQRSRRGFRRAALGDRPWVPIGSLTPPDVPEVAEDWQHDGVIGLRLAVVESLPVAVEDSHSTARSSDALTPRVRAMQRKTRDRGLAKDAVRPGCNSWATAAWWEGVEERSAATGYAASGQPGGNRVETVSVRSCRCQQCQKPEREETAVPLPLFKQTTPQRVMKRPERCGRAPSHSWECEREVRSRLLRNVEPKGEVNPGCRAVSVSHLLAGDDDAPMGWGFRLGLGCRVKRAVRLGWPGFRLGRREQLQATPQPGRERGAVKTLRTHAVQPQE